MTGTIRVAVATLALAGSAGLASFQGGAGKIAIINSRILVQNAPGYTEAQQTYDREVAGFKATVQKWSDSLEAMRKALAAQEATLSPAARQARQKEIDDRLDLYTRRQDSLTQVAQNRQREVMQPVFDLVTKVIQDMRNEEGFAVVIDVGMDATPVVAYDKNLDITDRVLAVVTKQPAPKIPAAEKAGAPAGTAAGIKKPPPDTLR